MPNLDVWAPRVLSLLRIIAALLFMVHGLMKLFHFPGPQPGAPDPLPMILMAAAYFMAHAPQGFWPALNGGEAAILYCCVFLYLVFAGPGIWSLDALVRKRP